MTTGQEELGAQGRRTELRAPTTSSVRASSQATREATYRRAPESATITAELPIAQSRPRAARSTAIHDASPGTRHEPAPVLLRFFVWLLVVLLVLAVAGVVVEQERPSWLAFVRNSSPAAAPAPSNTRAPKAHASSANGVLVPISKNSKQAVYAISSKHYSFVLNLSQPTYVEIKVPPGEPGFWYLRTLLPGKTPATVTGLTGSASLVLLQDAKRIEIVDGSRTLGVINSPKARFLYVFQPTNN